MNEFINESFELDPDDKYDKVFGEVLLTLKGFLIFHCTLCESKYQGLKKYSNHLKQIHQWQMNGSEIIERKSFSFNDIQNSSNIKLLNQDEPTKELINQHYCGNDEFETIVEVLEEDKVFVNNFLKSESKFNLRNNYPKKNMDVADEGKGMIKKPMDYLFFEDKNNEDFIFAERKVNNGCSYMHAKLPFCDRPNLNSSRKPCSSLTDADRKFKCPYCSYASKDKTNLWSHVRRHSNSKPYQCQHCPKQFHTRVELTFHTRYHTGEKPFKCLECEKQFVTKEQRKQHMKRHNNQRDYICKECEKSFYSSQELREHMVVHTNEYRHTCTQCKGTFSRQKSLRAHMKLHENKRHYRCNLCNAAFNQHAGLYIHMKNKHHEIKNANAEI